MGPVIAAVAQEAKALGLPRPVITSGNYSGHKQGSLHFKNRAIDFRGNNITIAQGKALAAKVSRLGLVGKDYDVIFETFPGEPGQQPPPRRVRSGLSDARRRS